MQLTIDERWRVRCSHEIQLPLSDSVVWGQMRDLRRFLTLDPLHREIHWPEQNTRAIPPVGSPILIEHRLLGIGPDRLGRLLFWREGRGYAVSDLSQRGVRVGFPHICAYEVESCGERASAIHISVRGRWTAAWMPRATVKLWLWWVMFSTGQHIGWYFRCLRLWRRFVRR
jgi:hypothetical protein